MEELVQDFCFRLAKKMCTLAYVASFQLIQSTCRRDKRTLLLSLAADLRVLNALSCVGLTVEQAGVFASQVDEPLEKHVVFILLV